MAIGHTDSPEDFKTLLKQRLRWDGDLSYIYLRKFRLSFSPKILGWRNYLFYVMYGLWFQIAMPFLIVGYISYLLVTSSFAEFAAIQSFFYMYYLIITMIMYLQYLLLVSERFIYDLKFIPYVFLFPLYTFVIRMWNAWSTVMEILFKSHLDSSMAPYWVIKKTKF